MRERPLWIPAIVLTPVAIAAIWAASARLETATPWPLIIVFATIAVGVDDWPRWVGRRLAWSHSGPVVVAAVVLAPASSKPLVGCLVIASTAFFSTERKQFRPDRFFTNIGHLVLEGYTLGWITGQLTASGTGGYAQLLAAIVIAQATSHFVSLLVVGAVSTYRFGSGALSDLIAVGAVLPMRELPAAAAVALMAGSAATIGSGWLPVAALMTVSLATLPLTRDRLAARRTLLITSVTDALGQRGFVGEPFERIERLALCAGRQLGMLDDELQQLRYASLSYAMADLFANELARPLDFPGSLRERATDFSRVIFYGLALSDVATRRVEEVADSAARLDGLLYPEEGETPLTLEEAHRELQAYDVDATILEALFAGLRDAGYEGWKRPLINGLLYRPLRRRRLASAIRAWPHLVGRFKGASPLDETTRRGA